MSIVLHIMFGKEDVNMQSRANTFFEQILSTHHCSRGWAKGSSLSICFLISRYEPWNKHTSMCCFLFFGCFFFTDFRLIMCFMHRCSAATVGKDVTERRVEKSNIDDKLTNNNCHFDIQRPQKCSSNSPVNTRVCNGHFLVMRWT